MVMVAGFERGAGPGALADMVRFRGIGGAVRAILGRTRRRHDARKAASQLLRMDPHLLRDIGVTRADVLGMLREPTD